MRANEFIVENNKSRTEEFHGVHMKLRDDGYEVVASALDDYGREMGSVVFNKGDGNELDPQDLLVIDKFRGQGIAKVMYDYVKSKGYEIHKSYDVTRIADQGKESGEYFWQKNRGEERIWEAFDRPYKTKTEKSEYGDIDMLAKLSDGTNLSIMFNNQGDDEWQVEFYRDNSQEVTGEGDAQRVFATVLTSIQKFIKKYKPWRLTFSATKNVEPGQNSESRAKLYNRLVQRYATAWGYEEYSEDHGDQITYELTRLKQGAAEGLNESAIFLNPNTVIVGQEHGRPLNLSSETLKRVQSIAAKHGAWYEGNGADRAFTKGVIDNYVGSFDDDVAKIASPNDPKWLYVLFANVDANNRVQRVGVNPKDTIFNRLLATAQDNSFQGIGFTPQALKKFLSLVSEGKYDFVKMSQQPATQENLTRFLKAGEALMWPSNWEQYPNRAGKIAKAATVDARDQYLASRKAGVYVVGSGHLKAVQQISGKQDVAEGTEQISIKVRKGRNKFATELSVDGEPAGAYQYDANSGRSIAEVDPEYRGKGLGKILVLHAIYTAAKLGMDFVEDESRTAEYDNVLDSLDSNGLAVNDDGYWYVTGQGEQYLKQRLKTGVAEGVPQPGPSSGAPKQFGPDAKIQTRQMTAKEIISSVPGVPYYNNVVDDWDAKDYSWGVTKKVIEYATYLKKHPETLSKLPPVIVLNGKFEDGAHRLSALWLLQQRMDPKNPLWVNAKLNVQFVKQGVAEDELEEDWKSKLATGAMAGAMAMGGAHATGPEWTERPDGSIVKTVKQVGNTIKDKITPSFMKKDLIAKAEPGISLLSRNNPEAEEVLHTTALKAGLRGAELAQFLAQTRHESADFAHMHEIGNKQRFAKYETPRLAKQLGNKYKGDGERFKGRGFIQLTGRDNYTRASEQIFGDDRLVKNPNLASRFDVASQIALWYWKSQVKPYVNNFNDTKAVTKAINPAMRGLQDRHDNFKQYMAVL